MSFDTESDDKMQMTIETTEPLQVYDEALLSDGNRIVISFVKSEQCILEELYNVYNSFFHSRKKHRTVVKKKVCWVDVDFLRATTKAVFLNL